MDRFFIRKLNSLSLLLTALFLAHTFLLQIAMPTWVFCIGNDGHVAIEYKKAPVVLEKHPALNPTATGQQHFDHETGCVDISIEPNLLPGNKTSKSHHYQNILQYFSSPDISVFSQILPTIDPIKQSPPLRTEPFHTLRTTILLI